MAFKEGDWVVFEHRGLERKGYISKAQNIGTRAIVTTTDGITLGTEYCVDNKDLTLQDITLTDEDLMTLIDISLASNDKEWFTQLSAK